MQSKISFTKIYQGIFFLFLIWYWFINPERTNVSLNDKIYITASLGLGFPIVWWIDTIGILGFRSLSLIPIMSKVFFYSKRGAFFFLVLCLVTLNWWSPYNEVKSVHVVEMTIVVYTTFVLLWLQPPGAFFLANANEDSGEALRVISNEKFPLRTVAMLKRGKLKVKRFSIKFSFLTDDCSIESEYEWRTLVDKISSKIGLIIFDVRQDSPSLTDELERFIQSKDGRIERTICISDIYGNVPALEKFTPEEIAPFKIIPINELRSFLSGSQYHAT